MKQQDLFGEKEKKFLTLKEASLWASHYLNRKVTISNIETSEKVELFLRVFGGIFDFLTLDI